jgi:hypothetical protein
MVSAMDPHGSIFGFLDRIYIYIYILFSCDLCSPVFYNGLRLKHIN